MLRSKGKKITATSQLGKVTYERAYDYDPEERRGYYPFDQQLGVKGGISEGVVRIVVKLSAHMPYQAARDVYEEVAGVAVSVGEIWNLTQAAGQRSRSAFADDEGDTGISGLCRGQYGRIYGECSC